MTMISANSPTANCTSVATRFSVVARIRQAHALWQQRRTLGSLDATALDDIGVTRAEAVAEANRPVWDAPENWCG